MITKISKNKSKRSIFICYRKGCRKYLKDPINLPCSHIVCREHVNIQDITFKCSTCYREFDVPDEGFKTNVMLNDIILKNQHLTGLHKKVTQQFNKLEKAIENFNEEHLGDPQRFIYEYYAEIINKIDVHRELLLARNKGLNIESIHNRSEKLLSKLKQLEQECYQNEQKIEKIDLLKRRVIK